MRRGEGKGGGCKGRCEGGAREVSCERMTRLPRAMRRARGGCRLRLELSQRTAERFAAGDAEEALGRRRAVVGAALAPAARQSTRCVRARGVRVEIGRRSGGDRVEIGWRSGGDRTEISGDRTEIGWRSGELAPAARLLELGAQLGGLEGERVDGALVREGGLLRKLQPLLQPPLVAERLLEARL